ncbi:hypothetical protein Shyhy02_79350 [Streptomyces hygroscopicus subsp. hygroscopicus]|nr:hypothetical protein Shyhy02_79350 [Streptomyces hygroscopicus subsp. hygroscopicus]
MPAIRSASPRLSMISVAFCSREIARLGGAGTLVSRPQLVVTAPDDRAAFGAPEEAVPLAPQAARPGSSRQTPNNPLMRMVFIFEKDTAREGLPGHPGGPPVRMPCAATSPTVPSAAF